ncbi:MAG: hypothetical protein HQL54_08050 [Magnetococcales bacterium]|nr:hypothetical protein [Magnetococcales bacterium]
MSDQHIQKHHFAWKDGAYSSFSALGPVSLSISSLINESTPSFYLATPFLTPYPVTH